MKKLLTSKNILQLILAVFAYITFGACYEIGNKSVNSKNVLKNVDRNMFETISSSNITSGFNGGALGMGIICASCVMGIVFIETSKK